MLYFSTLPAPFAPIGQPLCYTLDGLAQPRLELRVLTSDGRLLATKLLTNASPATVDLAPILRRVVRFQPTLGKSGFVASADRTITVQVEARCGAETVRSQPRTFRAALDPVTLPAICSALPPTRLIAPSECDEITIVAADPCRVTVTADSSGKLTTEEFRAPEGGVQCFRLAVADYPEAEEFTLTIEGLCTLRYLITPAVEGAVRLAWRTQQGAIEHYTFPLVDPIRLLVDKERAYTSEGYSLTSVGVEERWVLHSAYETAEAMRPLSELLYAEQVWRVGEAGYEPIDLVTEESELKQQGLLHRLSVTIRSTLKNKRLWS